MCDYYSIDNKFYYKLECIYFVNERKVYVV